MRDFFRPFRRKLGVVVLVVACGVMAQWMRSLLITDTVMFGGRFLLGSIDSHYGLQIATDSGGSLLPVWQTYEHRLESQLHDNVISVFRFSGFSACLQSSSARSCLIVLAPYWSIVAPLTLLSAWLLLRKQRSRSKPMPHA